MLADDIQEIEISIEDAKKAIRMGELVDRLEKNEDFKELILEGYFKEDASRIVMLKADKTFQTPEKQSKIDKDLLGISVFADYLRTKKILAINLVDSLREHELTHQELLQETIQ